MLRISLALSLCYYSIMNSASRRTFLTVRANSMKLDYSQYIISVFLTIVMCTLQTRHFLDTNFPFELFTRIEVVGRMEHSSSWIFRNGKK
jgi:hypothetical protein